MSGKNGWKPSGADLPGDDDFRPITSGASIVVDTPHGPAWAEAVAVSVEEQAAAHHNLLRYAELEKLRRGQANRYAETRYR